MTKKTREEECPDTTRAILEPWMIIEAIAHRQRLKRYHDDGVTPGMIASDIRAKYGKHRTDDIKDLVFSMDGYPLIYYYTGGGGYPMSFHFLIHPDFYPEAPLPDPYTEKERKHLRKALRERDERMARHKAEALQRRREREAERRDEERRRKARAKARPEKFRDPVGWKHIDVTEAVKVIREHPEKALILDTETTGLSGYLDDILELSIIDGNGEKVFSERFNSWAKEWGEAQAIHHISPEDVKDLPHIEERKEEISGLLEGVEVLIGYNLGFDVFFLIWSGSSIPDNILVCDVMEEFAEFYGEWAEWIDGGRGGWKWQKLTTASRYYKIPTTGAHGSLRDCEMTREVLLRLSKEPESERKRKEP